MQHEGMALKVEPRRCSRKFCIPEKAKAFRTTQLAVLKTKSNWALTIPTIKNYAYKRNIPPYTLQTEDGKKN